MGRLSMYVLTFIIIVAALSAVSPQVRESLGFPVYMRLSEGETGLLKSILPFDTFLSADQDGAVKINDKILRDEVRIQGGESVSIEPLLAGNINLEMRLFNRIPVRRISVNVFPKAQVVVGGHSIGVLLASEGVIVTDFSSVVDVNGHRVNPGRDAGIQIGDALVAIGGAKVTSIDDIEAELSAAARRSSKVVVTVVREGRKIDLSVEPALCEIGVGPDGRRLSAYRLGLYVRDSAAGVGTLTFVDPETGIYGALGHVVTDGYSNEGLDIRNGKIVQAFISGVAQGVRGRPGEKMGSFDGVADIIGAISKNTETGIYGVMSGDITNPLVPHRVSVASAEEVHEGPAKIFTVISGTRIEEFDVQIEKVYRQVKPSAKGLIIRVTDPVLLAATGGIVQGMSGSPILQDGKLVGAVTHVFVSDPTRGYGVIAEWMAMESGMLKERIAEERLAS